MKWGLSSVLKDCTPYWAFLALLTTSCFNEYVHSLSPCCLNRGSRVFAAQDWLLEKIHKNVVLCCCSKRCQTQIPFFFFFAFHICGALVMPVLCISSCYALFFFFFLPSHLYALPFQCTITLAGCLPNCAAFEVIVLNPFLGVPSATDLALLLWFGERDSNGLA